MMMNKWTFDALAQEDLASLETLMLEGTTPLFSTLADWEFRGFNRLTPLVNPAMKAMGFTRFAKGFYSPSQDIPIDEQDHIRGYNVMIQRGGLQDSWVGKPTDEQPKRHSFYQAYASGVGRRDFPDYDHALYLNYNISENGVFDGKGIRDYLVQVQAENNDLFLGKAYLYTGPLKMHVGYFILERWREHHYEG